MGGECNAGVVIAKGLLQNQKKPQKKNGIKGVTVSKMKNDKIKQLIPDSPDGLLKNINRLLDEYRKGNLQCMMLSYVRKEEGSTTTYWIGADDPQMFKTLIRLEHDMLNLYDIEAHVQVFEEE